MTSKGQIKKAVTDKVNSFKMDMAVIVNDSAAEAKTGKAKDSRYVELFDFSWDLVKKQLAF